MTGDQVPSGVGREGTGHQRTGGGDEAVDDDGDPDGGPAEYQLRR